MNTKNPFGIYFASAYILICLFIGIFNIGGEWGIMYISYFAFPFSIFSGFALMYTGIILEGVGIIFDKDIRLSIFVITNAIWWYFLGRLFNYIKNKRIYK